MPACLQCATGLIGPGDGGGAMRLVIYLGEAGSAIIDEVSVVAGRNPGVGYNYVTNGNFSRPIHLRSPFRNLRWPAIYQTKPNYRMNSPMNPERGARHETEIKPNKKIYETNPIGKITAETQRRRGGEKARSSLQGGLQTED
jgi:hypothetical protein